MVLVNLESDETISITVIDTPKVKQIQILFVMLTHAALH